MLRDTNGYDADDARSLSLPTDLSAIESRIVEQQIALWTIGPWVAYLDGKLSMNNDADVRRCLGQVAAIAERTGVAIVLVRDLNKKSGTQANRESLSMA